MLTGSGESLLVQSMDSVLGLEPSPDFLIHLKRKKGLREKKLTQRIQSKKKQT